MSTLEFTESAVGDIGTQLFWFNKQNSGSSGNYKGAFEYGVPVTAGAEFGGDVESFDAPETDLDYVPKVAGRTSLNDIQYTANYSKERYKRVQTITGKGTQTFMEVLDDNSAMIFQGTCGMPTIAGGDVRQINFTVVASYMLWIENINDIANEKTKLDALGLTEVYKQDSSTSKYYINIDSTTIPTARTQYYSGHAKA